MAKNMDRYGLGKAFLKGPKIIAAPDKNKDEKLKSQRFRLLRNVEGSYLALNRARQKNSRKSIILQLRHTTENPIHPLWEHLPVEQRTQQKLLTIRIRRLKFWLQQRLQSIILILAIYTLCWSIPLFIGQAIMTIFSILPLLLVPPVGFIIYWLVWKEFHA